MKITINKRKVLIKKDENINSEEIKENNKKKKNKENKQNNKKKEINKAKIEKSYEKFKNTKSFYAIFVSMVVIMSISLYLNFKYRFEIFNEDYYIVESDYLSSKEVISTQVQVENLQNTLTNNFDTRTEEIKDEISLEDIDNTTESLIKENDSEINYDFESEEIKEEEIQLEEIKEEVKILEFISPLGNDILKDYSDDILIYSTTLEAWKVHEGIDLKGNIGDEVIASESGVIEKIYFDSLYGNTIILKHDDGYKTVYSNVISSLNEEDIIEKGNCIGLIDSSGIIESKDESHIHFMMFKDDDIIDPNTKINFK